ncbi:MAG: antibiotic biosynthesis monooxygenase [Anaerolineae bacterium]
MIVRIWRTEVNPSRMAEFEEFERQHSMPMFRHQSGCLGVFFVRTPHDCAVISLWRDMASVEHLNHSPSYTQTVQRLLGTGMLHGKQVVEVFDVQNGFVDTQHLTMLLENTI